MDCSTPTHGGEKDEGLQRATKGNQACSIYFILKKCIEGQDISNVSGFVHYFNMNLCSQKYYEYIMG